MADFTGDDEETQKRRIAAVEGKNVLFITCFLAHYLYDRDLPVLARVASWGPKIHMVFGLDEHDREAKEKFDVDGILTGQAIFADIADDKKAGDNIVEAVKKTGIKFDCIFSPYEHAMALVGEVGEKLGLPCNPESAYSAARDKRLAREVCQKAGVPAPTFARVSSHDEIRNVAPKLGFPLIVKPSSGAGSDGVYRCEDVEDVIDKFDRLMEEMQVGKYFKWNPGCEPCVLLEEFIDGDEFDVDILMWDGKCVYSNVIDNWPCVGKGFLETGSNCPSVYPPNKIKQLEEYSFDCVKALGFSSGLFHVEVKYSYKRAQVIDGEKIGQPMLIEVNPRMGGGRTHMWHRQVWGVDLFDNFFLAACNIPINPPRAKEPICALADFDYAAPKTGTLMNTEWMDQLQGHPNVVWAEAYEMAGQMVKGLDDYIVPDWIGLLIIKADTPDNAVRITRELSDSLTPPIEDNPLARLSLGPDEDKMLSRQQVARRASMRSNAASSRRASVFSAASDFDIDPDEVHQDY